MSAPPIQFTDEHILVIRIALSRLARTSNEAVLRESAQRLDEFIADAVRPGTL